MTPSSSGAHSEESIRKASIHKLLLCEEVDLAALRAHSREVGGYIDNELRSRVWPKLLGINRFEIPDYREYVKSHKDFHQVQLDVERSLWYHDHILDWPESLRVRRRKALSDIIMAVLCRNPNFNYYQGYHDVVSVFLLVFQDDHLTFALTETLSSKYFLDYLGKDFEILSQSMHLITSIINFKDPELGSFLNSAKVDPFYATSWIITWFSHDVKNINDIARMYDVLLSSHPLLIYYLCAAMVINDRELVFECECDFSAVFSHLSKLPKKRKIEFENILILADKLIILIPPEKLKKIADFDVKKLIEEDLISNFHSPRHLNMKFVQSDWVLIRNKNMKLFMPIKINIKISPTVFQSNVRNIFQNFFLSPFIRNNYLFFQKFNVLKKLKFRKIFLKKNSRVAKEYSYEGPFENNSLKFNPRTFFSINNQLNHIYHDNNQFVALKKVAINLSFIATTTMENFQIFDDRLYSIEILFLTATILAGFSGGYYYCI